MVNIAAPWKSTETASDGEGAESEQEPREDETDVSRSDSIGSAESGDMAGSEDVSDMTRADFLDRRSFRLLFYARGLSPREVMELLDLAPAHVGTLMRYHDVGAFDGSEVSDDRFLALVRELTDEECNRVVQ